MRKLLFAALLGGYLISQTPIPGGGWVCTYQVGSSRVSIIVKGYCPVQI
jgi:hypothetical protein